MLFRSPYDLIVRGDTILDGRGQMPLMGIALFALLFVYMLRSDILRFIL